MTGTKIDWFTAVGPYGIPPLLLLPEFISCPLVEAVQNRVTTDQHMSACSALNAARAGKTPLLIGDKQKDELNEIMEKELHLLPSFDMDGLKQQLKKVYSQVAAASANPGYELPFSFLYTQKPDSMFFESSATEFKDAVHYLDFEQESEIPSTLDWPMRWIRQWPLGDFLSMKFRQFRYAACVREWYYRVMNEFDTPFPHAGILEEWASVCPEAYDMFTPDSCRLHGVFNGTDTGSIVSDLYRPGLVYSYMQVRRLSGPSKEASGFATSDSRHWYILFKKSDLAPLLDGLGNDLPNLDEHRYFIFSPCVYGRDRLYVTRESDRVDIFKDTRS